MNEFAAPLPKHAVKARPVGLKVPNSSKSRYIYVDPVTGVPMGDNLDLVTAVAWKGQKYATVSCERLYQPCCGFTRLSLGRARYFPRAEVEAWLPVFDDQLGEYVMALAARDDLELKAHLYEVLSRAAVRGRLTRELRAVYVSLTKVFRGAPSAAVKE